MATAPVVTERLTKRFGDRVALEAVDLELLPGEVFGYLGPNGAGKTTTMRLLLGALLPTSGTARIFGVPVTDPQARRPVGHLPGDLHLDPRLSTDDLVRMIGRVRGDVDASRVRALAERFDLDTTRRIRELSTGNRRKVGLVVAFAHRPRLVLLDEPTAGLDPLLQQEFVSLVRDEVSDGTTVLLSSHVLDEVEQLADRVGVIRRGRLVAVAGLDDLRRRAVQRISLVLDGVVDVSPLTSTPGVLAVELVHGAPGTTAVDLTVQGATDAVVRFAAAHHVHALRTHDDDLDEVFRAFYDDPGTAS